MLTHTQEIKKLYEDIQRKLFYMIPEKWEKLFLYASFIDGETPHGPKGELFFYYLPKGLFRKKPINVYEIPTKFNLNEKDYLQLVEVLYQKISEIREEFRKIDLGRTWTNLTIQIEGVKFHVEYDYEDLLENRFTSKERHIIWRYEKLGIGPEQVSKKEKEILEKYILGPKVLRRRERYDTGIYLKNIKNIIDYHKGNYEDEKSLEYIAIENERTMKNQILISGEELKNKNQLKK